MSDDGDMPPLQECNDLIDSNETPAADVCANNLEDSASSGDEEQFDLYGDPTFRCLFCSVAENFKNLLEHMKQEHGFSFAQVCSDFGFDQIQYIKFLNYTRMHRLDPKEIVSGSHKENWLHDDFMKPVLSDDSLLMIDVEDIVEHHNSSVFAEITAKSTIHYLEIKCSELQEIVAQQQQTMQRLLREIASGNSYKEVQMTCDLKCHEDESYFSSYSNVEIHLEMLSDKVRTEAYRDAIATNSVLLRNKKVLDVGCGTAILSMFCAKAGASVIAVDMSDVIYNAMDIVNENGMSDVITLKKGRVEDLEFNTKFDVIISEWMGYFLLFEGMLDSILFARDKYLEPGGLLMPNRCTMHLVGVEDLGLFSKTSTFWDNVYGFRMSCMQRQFISSASVGIIQEDKIVTNAEEIKSFDLATISTRDIEFTSSFMFVASRHCLLTCLVGYFDTYFDLPNSVHFSTGPHQTPTHWKQTLFFLPEVRPLEHGESLGGTIYVGRNKKEVRSLEVHISMDSQIYKYFIE